MVRRSFSENVGALFADPIGEMKRALGSDAKETPAVVETRGEQEDESAKQERFREMEAQDRERQAKLVQARLLGETAMAKHRDRQAAEMPRQVAQREASGESGAQRLVDQPERQSAARESVVEQQSGISFFEEQLAQAQQRLDRLQQEMPGSDAVNQAEGAVEHLREKLRDARQQERAA